MPPASLPDVPLTTEQRAIVEANLGLVHKFAQSCHPQGRGSLTLDDLIAEGVFGLIHAARNFDPSRGCKFSTPAVWWIRQAMQRAVLGKAHMIRIPAYQRGKVSVPVSQADDDWAKVIKDESAGPEDEAIAGEQRAEVAGLLRRLSKQYQDVIRWRFYDGLTLEQIGQRLGISKERVRQIEAKALAIMRRPA